MNIPQDLRYSKDHEWVRVEGDVAVVGITDFAQSELGDIVFVEVETEDETLEVDAVFGTIEAVKTVSDMFMPIAGTVIALNAELEDNPALINEDPYERTLQGRGVCVCVCVCVCVRACVCVCVFVCA